jgi:hypothetical protein
LATRKNKYNKCSKRARNSWFAKSSK